MPKTITSYRHYLLYAWLFGTHNPHTSLDLRAMTPSPHTAVLTGISSMATRAVLAELAQGFEARTGVKVAIESVGGVDAAKRVAAGEAFDLVLLASDALDKLMVAHHTLPGRVDYVHSPVAIAVPAGQPAPDVSSEAALRAAVEAAASIGYSTGPSGQHLMRLFERWGVADALASRTVQAKPGVPVGSQVASGEVSLGFQQLSELQGLPGHHHRRPAAARLRLHHPPSAAAWQQPASSPFWLRRFWLT
jgi:molybdate transport system substrate-binding protein